MRGGRLARDDVAAGQRRVLAAGRDRAGARAHQLLPRHAAPPAAVAPAPAGGGAGDLTLVSRHHVLRLVRNQLCELHRCLWIIECRDCAASMALYSFHICAAGRGV